MNKEEVEKQIQKMIDNKKCALCARDKFIDGCEVQMVSITESGKIESPYNSGMSSMGTLLPLCAYHMVLSQEGLIAMTTQGQVISPKILLDAEKSSEEDLNRVIRNLKRALKDEFNKSVMHTAKAVLNARKFQKAMEEGHGN
jgi:hypothetical protein